MFTRFGGHSHAVGFSLPSERVPELRVQLDKYARACLTLADFEPVLEFDAELPLDQITPEFFSLLQRLRAVRRGQSRTGFRGTRTCGCWRPPRVMKDKHVKLKLASALSGEPYGDAPSDSTAQTRSDGNWRKLVTYDALGWRMAERWQKETLLPGDSLDIAFTLGENDHPEFGGLELTLRDFKTKNAVEAGIQSDPIPASSVLPASWLV